MPEPPVPPELARILCAVTGEPPAWAAGLTPGARLEADLQLDSLEVAALADQLQHAYGPEVALLDFLATLGIDELIALSVADLAAYIARTGHRG